MNRQFRCQTVPVAGRSLSCSKNLAPRGQKRKAFLLPPGEGTRSKRQKKSSPPVSPTHASSVSSSSHEFPGPSRRYGPRRKGLRPKGQKRRASSPPSGEDIRLKRKRKDDSLSLQNNLDNSGVASMTDVEQGDISDGE